MEDRASKIYEEERPWGKFRQYTFNEVSTVKTILVGPGKRLSDQRHKNRHELWIFHTAGGKITFEYQNGEKKEFHLDVGDEVEIPPMTWHRLECLNSAPAELRLTEISFGQFDESDIERRSDDFGRA